MKIGRLLAIAGLSLIPVRAWAQAAPPPPPPVHEETFEAAFVGVTGNASSNTFGLGADLIQRPDAWLVRNKIAFVRNESNDLVTAKAFDWLARAERIINPRLSAFGEYNFFRDRFAGVVPRNAVTAGLAFKAVVQEKQSLSFDVGVGYLNEKRLTGDDISSGSWLLGSAYKAKISETAELTDDIRLTGIFSQGDNWRFEHGIALTTKLASGLSLKLSHGIRYANFPPPGFKKTDTVSSVSLVAKFATPR